MEKKFINKSLQYAKEGTHHKCGRKVVDEVLLKE
jgi:hypothetical protein